MQIERNTESETDLEKVHNLRLAWCAFRALSVRGPGERNSSVSLGGWTRGLHVGTATKTARAQRLSTKAEHKNGQRSWVPSYS